MHNFNGYLILSLFASSLPCILLQATPTTGNMTMEQEAGNEIGIGVILDHSFRPGKEVKVAIELAIQDIKIKTNLPLALYIRNSQRKPIHAAIAAKELIKTHKVKAILGGHTWEEASSIAEVISDSEPDHDHIPVFLSLASTLPLQATNHWPFFIQAVPTQSTQMNAVAAILQSMGVRQVTLISETASSTSIVSHLSQAFHQTGSELTHILPLTSTSCSLDSELETLKSQQRKVFIVHTSLELGVRLFQTAKKMNMIGDGYLWIASNKITDLFHSVNSTVMSSLKGLVGVKTYFPVNTPEFLHFRKRFRQKFRSDYTEEEQDEPGIFSVEGYNAMQLISPENFHAWKPIPATTVEIVHVHGKGYHSVYWTEGLGFSDTVEKEINGASNTYTNSMDDVGKALWPVQPWYADRRRRSLAESSEQRLRVGVPTTCLYPQFVRVRKDAEKNETTISGFAVEVFEEMMGKMNQRLLYDLIPSDLHYKELIEAIHSQEFDAVAADVSIIESRHELADFTQPYTETGLVMIVPVRSRISNQPWLFLKPFTTEMWWLIGVITIYNGFVIWLVERRYNDDLHGSTATQIGVIIWLAFSTLFTLRGDKMHSNLSRMTVIVWLFVALIITQSYVASLASMLTAQRLEPTITNVETLRNMNATVGYCVADFIRNYLEGVLKFENVNINSYNSTKLYAEALNNGTIAALFLEVPAAKVFLAEYCKSFIRTKETFKAGGFGFAFYKGFSQLSNANKALMNTSESGKLKQLEDKYLINQKCVDGEPSLDEKESLNLRSFWVLFLLTGGTSTLALLDYIITRIREFRSSTQGHTNLYNLVLAFIKIWRLRMRRSSGIVADIEMARQTRIIV